MKIFLTGGSGYIGNAVAVRTARALVLAILAPEALRSDRRGKTVSLLVQAGMLA